MTLKIFSATGGIEKVCRVAGKALYESSLGSTTTFRVYSMYDKQTDADHNKYFPSESFHGFAAAKLRFIFSALRRGKKSNTIIISHVNLLIVGWLIKKISPSTKIILFAHGIEVWELLNKRQKIMLGCCDKILSVSHFTSEKLQEMHHVPASKCKVLNNCLDPFLPEPPTVTGKRKLRNKYGYDETDTILFTLTRLSSAERYKGYDKVLQAMVDLNKLYPCLRYLLAGSYDKQEKEYLDNLITKLKLNDLVFIAGFIHEEDLVDYFCDADIYVMPSTKEGFGIVFIEAMYYGLPVIAGNIDGSVDALDQGRLGSLVDPLDVQAIEEAIYRILKDRSSYIPDRQLLMKNFSYENYKGKLENLINE